MTGPTTIEERHALQRAEQAEEAAARERARDQARARFEAEEAVRRARLREHGQRIAELETARNRARNELRTFQNEHRHRLATAEARFLDRTSPGAFQRAVEQLAVAESGEAGPSVDQRAAAVIAHIEASDQYRSAHLAALRAAGGLSRLSDEDYRAGVAERRQAVTNAEGAFRRARDEGPNREGSR